MKKILAALTLSALIFTACTETDTLVTVDLSRTTATEVTTPNTHSHMMLKVSNTTANEATIQWEHTETTSVVGWTYNVDGSFASSGVLTIPANGSVNLMLMVIPNGIAGTGAGTLKFYDSEDQTLSMKTFTYSVTTVTQYFEVITMTSTSQTIRPNDSIKDYEMKVYNPNTADITVNWNSTMGASNPSIWAINVCDPNACFGPEIIDGDFIVPAGDSAKFNFTIDHKATSGIGSATANFYVPTDSILSITSQTVNHTVL